MDLIVIIPTWKRVKKLEACLTSLVAQSRPPQEVFLTVRPEDLETLTFLRDWVPKQALPLTVVEVSAPGVIYAENQAIERVQRKYHSGVVVFMDDDAVAYPDWLAKIDAFFSLHKTAAGLGGPDIIMSEPWSYHDHSVTQVGIVTVYGKVIGNHHRKSHGLRPVDVLKGVNMAIRVEWLTRLDQKLQGEDPRKGNGVFWELDLCLGIKRRGGQLYFDPELLIQHDSDHRHFLPQHVVASTAHNLAYVLWKHLPWQRCLVFMTYSLLIGNSHIWGLGKTLLEWKRQRSISVWSTGRASVVGFLTGLTSSFRSLR